MESLLVIGCGYLGRRLAARWNTSGGKVWATTRSETTAEEFRSLGWDPVVLDLASPEGRLPAADNVVWAVGYDRSAGIDRRRIWIDGLKWVLVNGPEFRSFSYVSSTSVYGDVQDELVDERTALRLSLIHISEPTRPY